MRRIGALLLVATALAVATTLWAYAPQDDPSLPDVWRQLVGSRGYLEASECRYVFTLGTPTQEPSARVTRVAPDHVVILESRGGERVEYVIPLAQATLRRPAR